MAILLASRMMAGNPPTTAPDARHQQNKKVLATAIGEHLSDQNLTEKSNATVAYAEVQVDENGNLQTILVNAANDDLKAHIARQIGEMKLEAGAFAPGERFAFRIEFRYRAS